MKSAKKIEDVKIGEVYKISDIVKIESESNIDVKWFQVGSNGCRITKINK